MASGCPSRINRWTARTSSSSGSFRHPAQPLISGLRQIQVDSIYQSIEILSKEKGIDPQIVLDAVKDAMLIAARKHFRTTENYDADMDPKTGAIALYAVKKVVEAVADPAHEMTLAEARRIDQSA